MTESMLILFLNKTRLIFLFGSFCCVAWYNRNAVEVNAALNDLLYNAKLRGGPLSVWVMGTCSLYSEGDILCFSFVCQS